MKSVVLLLATVLTAAAQPTFLGHKITVTTPELDEDGFFPKGPSSVCVELSPRQCYTAPEDFGRYPKVDVVPLKPGKLAILFAVSSGGVSGFRIHYALLEPGDGRLENLLPRSLAVSDQSQHAVWQEASLSKSPLFMTADSVRGPAESNRGPHRYIVSTYALRSSPPADEPMYFLQDQFMTVRRYDLDKRPDILAAEKPEILARLRRIKAARH